MQATEGSESDKPKSEMKELMQKKMTEMEGIYAAKVTFLTTKRWMRWRDLRSKGNISDHKKIA
jgi:hypothetical protein